MFYISSVILTVTLVGQLSFASESVFSECPSPVEAGKVLACEQKGQCENGNSDECAVQAFYLGRSYGSNETCGVILLPGGGRLTKLYVNNGQNGDVGLDPAISGDMKVEVFRKSKCAQDTSGSSGANACIRVRNPRTGELISWTSLKCK